MMRTAVNPRAPGLRGPMPVARQPHCVLARRLTPHNHAAAPDAISAPPTPATAPEVVDQVLALVQGTDGGIGLPEDKKAAVDTLLGQLEEVGRQQQPRPNESPLLWGNYAVAYTSTRQAPNERGQPAGGRFRGPIGRALFRTEGLFQACLQPDLCVNKVAFRLFGFVRGSVGLRGRITPLTDVGDRDTVRVRFEPTALSFGDLHLRLGKPSEVQLTTTYLDERVRLGKGSRGSLFVFTRGGDADAAGLEAVGTAATSRTTLVLATATYVAAMLGALALFLAVPHPLARAVAGAAMAVGGLMALVLRGGGIIQGDQAAIDSAYWARQRPAVGGASS